VSAYAASLLKKTHHHRDLRTTDDRSESMNIGICSSTKLDKKSKKNISGCQKKSSCLTYGKPSSSASFISQYMLQYQNVKHGMTARQEDCAYSCN